MGKEEKRREVDGSAVEGGGDAKPVRFFFYIFKLEMFWYLKMQNNNILAKPVRFFSLVIFNAKYHYLAKPVRFFLYC